MSSSDPSVILGANGRLSPVTINSLPDELLAKIFDCCRLHDEYGWNYRRQWYNPLQVCRRWRYIMLEWSSRLKLFFLCNLANPISTIPSHFPPIPIILCFRYYSPTASHPKEGLIRALRLRVCALTYSGFFWRSLELGRALNNSFPMLETLSLYNDNEEPQVLPDNFVAPRLRALHLQQIDISRSSLLTNATNLLSLRLHFSQDIVYGYLTPEYLVEHLASMPHLENIWLELPSRSSLPKPVGELPHPQITRVVLPSLSRLVFKGTSPYLDDLLSRISTPVLRDYRHTGRMEETPDVLRLSEFLCIIKNLNLRSIEVSFSIHTAIIEYYLEQPSVVPYLKFRVNYTQDHAVASVTQFCSAVARAIFPRCGEPRN